MPLPVVHREQVVDKIVGRILGLRDLLDNDLALALDLRRIEDRFKKDVREQISRHRQILAEHFRVVTGVFLASERVQYSADGVDLFCDLRGGTLAGALEEQMLDKMRDPVLRRLLVTRSVLNPDSDRG